MLAWEAASAKLVATENDPPQLKKLIEEKQFRLEHVFNADEMELFWKRMP